MYVVSVEGFDYIRARGRPAERGGGHNSRLRQLPARAPVRLPIEFSSFEADVSAEFSGGTQKLPDFCHTVHALRAIVGRSPHSG